MAKTKFNTTIPLGTFVALKGETRTDYGKITKVGIEICAPKIGTKVLLVKFKPGRTLVSREKHVTFDKDRHNKFYGKK